MISVLNIYAKILFFEIQHYFFMHNRHFLYFFYSSPCFFIAISNFLHVFFKYNYIFQFSGAFLLKIHSIITIRLKRIISILHPKMQHTLRINVFYETLAANLNPLLHKPKSA